VVATEQVRPFARVPVSNDDATIKHCGGLAINFHQQQWWLAHELRCGVDVDITCPSVASDSAFSTQTDQAGELINIVTTARCRCVRRWKSSIQTRVDRSRRRVNGLSVSAPPSSKICDRLTPPPYRSLTVHPCSLVHMLPSAQYSEVPEWPSDHRAQLSDCCCGPNTNGPILSFRSSGCRIAAGFCRIS